MHILLITSHQTYKSDCRRYHRNGLASIRGTTADQSQFHETNASPSVQPINRKEEFSQTH